MSTSGDVQYIGGSYDACRGIKLIKAFHFY